MKMECLIVADKHHLLPLYTATGFPVYTQCEQTPGLDQGLLESTQFASTLSTPYFQTIPQDLQSLSPSGQLSYSMVDLESFQAGSMVHAVTGYNGSCFSGPSIQPAICQRDASFTYPQSSWMEYGRQSVCLATPYLPCIYSTPLSSIEEVLVQTGGSPDNAFSSNWGAVDSDAKEAKLVKSLDDTAVAGSRGGRRSKKAHESMRTTPLACSTKRINFTPYPPCKPFKCQLKAQGSQEKEVCGRSFARIEHLRRHMTTVHSGSRTACKVPLCRKSFSRRDNLYDHYWTHVDLGRPGRNRKLSLRVLKEILGSKDRCIFRILVRRMNRPRRPSRWNCRRRHDCNTG
jgi:hypothetical protein